MIGSLNIVICNIQMTTRTGTEIVTRDLALGLKARGHHVSVLCPHPEGGLSDELRAKNVQVSSEAGDFQKPDIIHINHMESAQTLLDRFPDVPAIFVCHDATTNHSYAQLQPSIKAFFGVSDASRQRVANDTAIPLSDVGLLPNYVDLNQIPLRKGALPFFPRRWLFVAEKQQSEALLAELEPVARLFRAKLDAVGPFIGKVIDDLPAHFLDYDLVFASARCAMEASATGAGVIVCDSRGLAGFLTPELWRRCEQHNLGLGGFDQPNSFGALARAVLGWRPWKAKSVSKIIRTERALSNGLGNIEAIYRNAIG